MNAEHVTPHPTSDPVAHVMKRASASLERGAHVAAARYLMRHRNERAIVVVDDTAQEPVGIVTDCNVARLLALGHDPDELRVSDTSPRAPLSVDSAASVRDAAIAMLHHGVQYLPVIDDGHLVGVVSLRDVWQQLPQSKETRCDDDE
jgi:CBS domain-containing protein